ncbi:ABC transporter permease [Bradyrhizobium sp.]|uniref:ABC transporter permease n=1 Tax=Bradyrhizobium sp. TaxID=376 RepID=UPI0040377915
MVVVLLLATAIGLFAVMVQGALATRQQLESLQANVRTVIELREAGAFGTGGFGEDKPVGTDDFSVATLEAVKRVPNARHITRIEEYVHTPQIDPSKPNAYAMIIGLRPGAPMRAIGEVDYENARIIAGRGLGPPDERGEVAVVGKLYAKERLGISTGSNGAARLDQKLMLNGTPLEVVGVYSTGNDFGDNHVFVPLDTFRRVFNPGGKLSKIRVTVDSVANVDTVTEDLKRLEGVDAVTAAEQVATARATLGSIAAATFYGSLLIFAIGGVLVVFIMVLATRERINEIGTLKAIGASNAEIAMQFVAEVLALTGLAAVIAVLMAALFGLALGSTLGVNLRLDRDMLLIIVAGGLAFALLGSFYPVFRGVRLSPVEAMKST